MIWSCLNVPNLILAMVDSFEEMLRYEASSDTVVFVNGMLHSAALLPVDESIERRGHVR